MDKRKSDKKIREAFERFCQSKDYYVISVNVLDEEIDACIRGNIENHNFTSVKPLNTEKTIFDVTVSIKDFHRIILRRNA